MFSKFYTLHDLFCFFQHSSRLLWLLDSQAYEGGPRVLCDHSWRGFWRAVQYRLAAPLVLCELTSYPACLWVWRWLLSLSIVRHAHLLFFSLHFSHAPLLKEDREHSLSLRLPFMIFAWEWRWEVLMYDVTWHLLMLDSPRGICQLFKFKFKCCCYWHRSREYIWLLIYIAGGFPGINIQNGC